MKIEIGTANRTEGPWKIDQDNQPPTDEQIIAWAKAGELTYRYPEVQYEGDRVSNPDEIKQVHGYGPSGEHISHTRIEDMLEAGILSMVARDLTSGMLYFSGDDDNTEEE